MPKRSFIAIVAVILLASVCQAAEVPEDLSVWREWVLHGKEEQVCPPAFNSQGERRCYWPSTLDLDLTGQGGRFDLHVRIFAPSWVALPGGPRIWPQDVQVQGLKARVALHRGSPALYLEPGRYAITGNFAWDQIPESVPVPRDSGLVTLSVEGKKVPFPDLASGRLWLKDRAVKEESAEDSLEIQVYRRLEDTIPFRVVTRLEVDVAGGQREVLVGPVLPSSSDKEMFVPVRLNSPLTARLENDGRLRIQVRPGHWRIEVQSRSAGPVEKLPVPALDGPWPTEEIWVFAAHTDLRVVEPAGLSPVDPRQTTLPPEWHDLPAFLAQPGQELAFNLIRRGDTDPAPDRISINREMWLDFDGGGYTVVDRINGTMSRSHRLEASEDLKIGRVTLSGEDMLITRLPGSERYGVEVRHGELNLAAASRMEGSVSGFPASGWDHDFVSAGARLNVPPGWEVVAVGGVDNRPPTWLQQWTLLDLFLVLIISIASFRMLGRPAGVLALAALALTWHAPYAPASVWLHILIATALVKHLPEGRLKKISRWYRVAAFAVLIFLFIPFAVDQVRTALYPQLEQQGIFPLVPGPAARQVRFDETMVDQFTGSEMELNIGDIPAEQATPEQAPAPQMEKRVKSSLFSLPSNVMLQQIDKDALVQTGPGLPSWRWKSFSLQLNGPVSRDQRIRVFYITPLAGSGVRIVRVLLVAFLGLLMAGVHITLPGRTAVKAALLAALLLSAGRAEAAPFPPAELLKEYETRLLEPPECMPDCAQASRMRLEADPGNLRLLVEVHALADVAVPLPGSEPQWLPEKVLIDGSAPQAISRAADGTLWAYLNQGVHQIILEGKIPGRTTVQISLALPVHRVTASVKGWMLEGIHENGVPDRQLQLTRIRKEGTAGTEKVQPMEAETLPPFVIVERTLMLGLEWRTRTTIRRLSPPGTAVVLEVPLLAGESVITDGVRVEEGKVLVNMGSDQQEMSWDCALQAVEELILTAPATDGWVESWQAEVSPIWHMQQTGGIAVAARQDPRGVWAPLWRPWPGEEVRLAVTRPRGVAGSTFTIDQSSYRLKPGKQATDAVLTFAARSSLGGQHVIGLPPGAELTGITIDGLMQPIRPEEGRLTLPVHPGVQNYTISWRLKKGMNTLYTTSAVDLGSESVNQHLNVTMPPNRWMLFAGGPRLGPAVLFWSVIAVIFLLAYGLSRTGITPLGWLQWTLLGLGLTQVSIPVAAVIVGWLLALGFRSRVREDMDARRFDFIQIGLAFLTVLAAFALVSAVKKGLLGYPEMQVMGNGSTAYNLLWYSDRVAGPTAKAWVLSVPMFVYRLLMLAWALWLASSLISWLKWGWESVTKGGYWRKLALLRRSGKKMEMFEVEE